MSATATRVKPASAPPLPSLHLLLYIFLLLLVSVVSATTTGLVSDTCDAKNHQVTINPHANVFIGVLVGASGRGEGMYGCGGWREQGIVGFEAVKWSLARVNLGAGGLGSRILSDTFVPGVRFGVRVYDTCMKEERAGASMSDLFPIIREGKINCTPVSNTNNNNSTSSTTSSSTSSTSSSSVLGILDLTGATTRHANLANLVKKYEIPILDMQATRLVPPEQRGRALVGFLSKLGWEAVSILAADDNYSMHVAKVVSELAVGRNVCISGVVKVPALSEEIIASHEHPAKVELEYRNLVRVALGEGKVAAVVVVAAADTITQILSAIRLESSLTRDLLWLLSDLPESNVDLVKDVARVTRGVYVLSVTPRQFPDFETHWKGLQDVQLKITTENEWALSYLQQEKGCQLDGLSPPTTTTTTTTTTSTTPTPVTTNDTTPKLLPECRSFRMRDDGLDVLARTHSALPPIHGLFSYFSAVKNAWRLKCRNRRGMCPSLEEMQPSEFLSDYLSPLKFRHDGPGTRSLPGLRGGKERSDRGGRLSGSPLGLYAVIVDPGNTTVGISQMLIHNNATVEVTDASLLRRATSATICHLAACHTCAKLPGAQVEFEEVKTTTEAQAHVLLPSPDHIVVVGLFPIHNPSEDGLDCSDTINGEALQESEAFLWAVDQVNAHTHLLPATSLGALVLDTCGSRIRTMNQVTSLAKSALPGVNINIGDVQALVTSLDPETARVTGEVLASLNLTSINTGPSLAHYSPFALQMSAPVNTEAEAMVQILRFLGWDYVSLVSAPGDVESAAGAESFRTVAQASRICLALDLKMPHPPLSDPQAVANLADELISQLTEKAVSDGSRAAVLFLPAASTAMLLQAVDRAVSSHRLLRHQLVLLGSSTWGHHKDRLGQWTGGLGGALVLKDGQRDVGDFTAHYRLLQPQTNKRNPWFAQYWRQEFGCVGSECPPSPDPPPVVPYTSVPSTPRVIQAVFSFGAALTQLLDHLCPQFDGALCPGLPKWRQRTVLNEFLRNTEVSRVDQPSEYFQFTENFHGNAPLEVLSLAPPPPRPKESQGPVRFRYEKVGRYVANTGLTLGSALIKLHNGSVERMDKLPSTCLTSCANCQQREPDYAFLDSPDNLYIMATLNVHKRGDRPLECGQLNGDQGIQEVEALLWALKGINADPRILPGITLGSIILDACMSKEKIVRDVTNILTGRIPDRLRKKLPSPNNIVGLVVSGGNEEVARQVIDVTQPYTIATVAASAATDTIYSNTRRFPALLRLAPANDVLGRAITSLLEHYRWEAYSIVYSDGGTQGDVHKHLVREAHAHGLKTVVAEPVPLKVDTVDYMVEVWGRLAGGGGGGAGRVVVLLLEPHHASLFLRAASLLRARDLLPPGHFVLIMTESPWPYLSKDNEGLGMLVVQPISGAVPGFRRYFSSLSLTNHTAYPWFHEFWSQTFKCRGASCFTGGAHNLSSYSLHQAPGVVGTINAVTVLAQGLNQWRREACQGKESACEELTSSPQYRETLFRYARSVTQRGADGKPLAFTVEGQNRAAKLQILNFRHIPNSKGKSAGLVRVGYYSDESSLALNSTMVVMYDAEGAEVPMTDVTSKCGDAEACGGGGGGGGSSGGSGNGGSDVVSVGGNKSIKRTNYLQMYARQRFGISGLVPYHRRGSTFFSCGGFWGEAIFQNIAAIAYALTRINTNDAGVGLGAILFDYCGRTERARERFFSFFSGEASETDPGILLGPGRIVASISFADEAAEAVSNILSANYVPHFSSPVGGVKLADRVDTTILTSVPSRTAELRTILAIAKEYKWTFLSVIYDNDEDGRFLMETFRRLALKQNICIGDSLGLPKRVSEEYAREVIETLAVSWKPKVVVMLVDATDNIHMILKASEKLDEAEHFTFLSGAAWGNKPTVTQDLDRVSAGALTFTMETYDLPDFRSFIANLTLENHEPFPDEWFEEYFQEKFQCRLSSSSRVQRRYINECQGTESTHADDIVQDPYVFHTILGINAIAHGLDAYITKQCAEAKTIDDCNIVQAEMLLEILHQSKLTLNNTNSVETDPYDQPNAYGYHIWNYRKIGKEYGYVNVGKWENGNLRLEIPSIEFKIGTFAPDSYCTEGVCLEVCSSQSTVYAAMALPKPLPIDANFHSVYGITTGIVSLLGIVVILVTMVYFSMSFPTAAGTSVLGYKILIGCLMLYAVNFAFIFQPTIGTCAVRRFLMGVSYAVIFSAMLVKVIHTWRIITYTSGSHDDPDILTRPGGLLLVSMALVMVQIILGAAWLILYPPEIDLEGNTWRCTPTEDFEAELVISLVYVMVLVAATILFCLETWQADQNSRETRWILLASLCTSISWCVWTVVATQAVIEFRDPAVVIGNLVSATSVLLFLYARKMYLYTQLNQDVKDLEMRSHYTAATSLYNASLNAQKLSENMSRTPPGLETNAGIPGRQFVGEQEVSFRTVTLPPETPQSHPSSSRPSTTTTPSLRRSLHLSISDDLPEDLTFDAFESSEEDFPMDAHHLSETDDVDAMGAGGSGLGVGGGAEGAEGDPRSRLPSIRRVGSRQMLVFLTDGNTIGDVSRI